VAVGLAVAPELEAAAAARPPPDPARKGARPFALVIAPTRELAAQIAKELGWLFDPLGVGVTSVTGGASYVRELGALRRGPLVVAGTPGRLLDHLGRGAIDPSALGVVVLDEADQMLDLGFRDELLAILEKTPASRRTLLLSATFPREVQRLADACQRDPLVAAAAGAGERHADIAHVAHLVLGEERDKALVNLLLMAPGERALVFVRTREGAAELADNLSDAGLPARAIHGDMDQRDRTRTLDAFRAGTVTTLVATDVAARGLDVPDVTRVIHADPPGDAEVLTHRSGRTGRAGKKGTSIVLVPPGMREKVRAMLRRAGVEASWSPAPSAAEVLRAADERLCRELVERGEGGLTPDPRLRALATELLAKMDATDLMSVLLGRVAHAGPCAPAEVTPILPPSPRRAAPPAPPVHGRGMRAPVTSPPPPYRRDRGAPPAGAPTFVPFRINWGERHGADPRRLLALVCRRGGIRGSEVGAIRIGVTQSSFEVAADVAPAFARAAREPDARDPRIRIEAEGGPGEREEGPPRRPAGGHAPPRRRTHGAA
jgi:ATP-dependent RNA helicase DeaD